MSAASATVRAMGPMCERLHAPLGGDAVERAVHGPRLHERTLGRLRLAPCRLVGQRHEGVELGVDALDPVEDRVHDLDRRDPLSSDRRRQLRRRQPAEPLVSHPSASFLSDPLSSQDERWNTTILSSVISLIAYAGPSLPNPDSLSPPYGIRSARHWGPQLTWRLPDWTSRANFQAHSRFSVKIPAASP